MQQPMYQQYQPVPVQHRPPVDLIRPLASDFLLAVGIVVGLFLMMIGTMISGATSADLAGHVLASFGSFLVAAVLLFGAIIRVDADKLVRLGFILAAAYIIVGTGLW